jgi:hypothetical protein
MGGTGNDSDVDFMRITKKGGHIHDNRANESLLPDYFIDPFSDVGDSSSSLRRETVFRSAHWYLFALLIKVRI